ncbi:MAG TPA: AmpG family muropeptide MFS transporter [Stellaceae bacterium]|jgi:PAT family beta-lactamase induction signal transducer AmpG|nr:AmpG family muropeptide MFS transporter [Stellaceae bacterium]
MSGSWLRSLRIYRDPRMIAIVLMGFASGLPLALTGATLAIWLKESAITLTAIGLFAPVGISYNLKFLWAPAMDRVRLPFLTARFGRRRGWALLIQFLLALAILALGASDPSTDLTRVAICALVVAFLSASQDVVIDAYRVELLTKDEQGAGAAATQIGYRLGMLASGAGALYLAQYFSWSAAYGVMAVLMLASMIVILATREPQAPPVVPGPWLKNTVIAPFADFAKRRFWLLILIFVVLYKFGDALAGVMSGPFYIELGFEKSEIASITKVFGVIASIVGVSLGGIAVYRWGLMRALLLCGALQMVSNLMYLVQLWAGHDVGMLAVTIAAENITGSMASAAFVAYLSSLCSPAFTATQYALLSALAATARTMLASSGGFFADHLGWGSFFVLATACCLPGLALLLFLMRSADTHQPQAVVVEP